MILGRLITRLDAPSHSIVRPKWLTKIFVVGDILSFCVQGGGTYTNTTHHLLTEILAVSCFCEKTKSANGRV